jgi:hypothetical protein
MTLTLLATAALFGPVLSQGVQLVKGDVAVVATGYRVSKLIGTGVTNDKNEKIGTLDDIVIGQNRDLFAVLQVGGFLGINAHLIAVPNRAWSSPRMARRSSCPAHRAMSSRNSRNSSTAVERTLQCRWRAK